MDKYKVLPYLLVIYLLVVGCTAAYFLVSIFPEVTKDAPLGFEYGLNSDQGLMLIAMLSGVAGSFISAAQSLSAYIGNDSFKRSWAMWYLLRPWIGGVLGLAIFFSFRAGLVSSVEAVSPYGVAAIGLLGGWFSKSATDKLEEVFDVLFATDADDNREDPVKPTPVKPTKSDSESK